MAPPAPPSALELERDRRISRNLEVIQRLGLGDAAADSLRAKLSTYSNCEPQAAPLAKRPKLVRKLRAVTAEAPPARASKRMRGEAPPTAEEIREAVAREEEELSTARATGRLRPALALQEGVAATAPFTLRSIGTTVWHLGEIYRGPWPHRFWSGTGCRHHHAYPVGFKASKLQFGRVYHMQIEAGPQGPVFKVMEGGTGRVYAGHTPTSPWTEVCLALRTGQRISGPLFFGFSDAVTMRAIAELYSPQELQAAQQGGRVQGLPRSAAEAAAEEFASVEGVTEAAAVALATTTALGGAPHASLAALRRWARGPGNCRRLQAFLLDSEELPTATRKWPAWRQQAVPRILRALCGDAAVDALCQSPGEDAGSSPQAPAGDAEAPRTEASCQEDGGESPVADTAVQKENRQLPGAGEAGSPAAKPARRAARGRSRRR